MVYSIKDARLSRRRLLVGVGAPLVRPDLFGAGVGPPQRRDRGDALTEAAD